MKKKVVALLLAILFSVSGMIVGEGKVYAEDSVQDVEMSEVWTDGALVGYGESQTWGIYLLRGMSIINNAGGGKIGCGGITEAAVKCKVSVNTIVEKKVNGSWTRVTSWTNTSSSAYSVSISKYLSVGSGYYYRVRSIHTAASDGSSSCTDSLWI